MKKVSSSWHLCLALGLHLLASTYLCAQMPRVDSVVPSQGPIAGGTIVTVTGANFSSGTVQVDKKNITPMSINDNQILLQMPKHDNGYAQVKIRNTFGTGYGEFLYVPPRLDEIPPGYITTIAGVGIFCGDGRPATQAMVAPSDVMLDKDGNIYLWEWNDNRIRRIRNNGIIETFAGKGGLSGFAGDGGSAEEALFNNPRGAGLDTSGNIYIADSFNHRIRKIDAHTGIISTVAGTGDLGFSGDGGPASQAQFNFPNHVVVDKEGNIFLLDGKNMRIRRITPDGIITSYCGTGVPGFSGDGGPAINAQFNLELPPDEGGLAIDQQGNLYLADSHNNRIRRIDRKTGIINTIGNAGNPAGVAVDLEGNVYFDANQDNARITKMNPNGQITATYGRGQGFSPNGTVAVSAPLGWIQHLTVDHSGNIIFTEDVIRLRRINAQTGLLETLAGIGPRVIGETGPAIATVLSNEYSDIAFLPSGELLVGDWANYLLRKLDKQGNISTVAGGGSIDVNTLPSVQSGIPAKEAHIASLVGLEVDSLGNIFYAGLGPILKIDREGIIRRVVGKAGNGFAGDGGPAADALMCQPYDVIVDKDGNIYIADTNNNRIRKVDARTGIINTIAGIGPTSIDQFGSGGFGGDGGPAIEARLNSPVGIALDKQGNLFIADEANARIRRVDKTGTISTFAEGNATKLVFDKSGNLYTAVNYNVFRYQPDGTRSSITGLGSSGGFSGDGGLATSASVYIAGWAAGVAIDEEGNLFFCDSRNRRVRAIRYGAVTAPQNCTSQISQGARQSTSVSALLIVPIQVTVHGQFGNPANGVRVDFCAPSSGASCVFPNGSNTFSAFTDTSGKATVRPFTNNTVGTYEITATPLASSTTLHFSITNISIPSSVTLLTPIDTANNVSTMPILAWRKSAGAVNYRLQLSKQSTFPATVFDDSTLVDTTKQVGPLENDVAYYWRVNARNDGGTSAWSQVRSFTTIVSVPQVPTLSVPADSARNVQLNTRLSWKVISGATLYHLQVSTALTFTSLTLDDSTLATTSKAIGPLSLATSYYWRVRAKNEGGWGVYSSPRQFSTIRTTSVEQNGDGIPTSFSLSQNHPNPFNPSTLIQFALPKGSQVSLKVYDLLGREVAMLVSQELGGGYYQVRWQAEVPSGTYLYRLQAGEFVGTKKMILLH